jgi:hypothetical protein
LNLDDELTEHFACEGPRIVVCLSLGRRESDELVPIPTDEGGEPLATLEGSSKERSDVAKRDRQWGRDGHPLAMVHQGRRLRNAS